MLAMRPTIAASNTCSKISTFKIQDRHLANEESEVPVAVIHYSFPYQFLGLLQGR